MKRTPLHSAALLGHPWREPSLGEFSADELRAAGKVLLKQSVSLQRLRVHLGQAWRQSPLSEFIERDENRHRRERNEFEEIRRRLAQDGVDTMLLKSAGLHPSFHYLSSNLDVIVREGNVDTARRHLTDIGYIELLNVEEPKKFLFRRFPGDGTSFAFHLHEVVGWGVPFVDNDQLWNNARMAVDDPDIRIPGPTEALKVTLAHWFYEDKTLSLGNMFLTAQALRELDVSLDEPAGDARRRGWEEGFWGALSVFDDTWRRFYGESGLGDSRRAQVDTRLRAHRFVREEVLTGVTYPEHEPARIPFMLNKVAYYKKILADTARSQGQKFEDVIATVLWAVRWKLHVRSQRPLLVSISGLDGSGKSLQVDRLRYVFDTCDLRNRTIWARGATSRLAGFMISLGKRLLGRKGSASEREGSSGEAARYAERQQLSASSPAVGFAFSLLLASDLLWACVIKPRLYLLTGNLVVCDRYLYDALVDFALYTGGDVARPPTALRWLERLAPRPGVAVLLDVKPAEALARKPEEGGIKYLEKARECFMELARSRAMMVLSGEESAEKISQRITEAALGKFYQDYGTILNGLLYSNQAQLNPRRGR